MPFNDLSESINKLEKEGEALWIEEEIDWDLEVGGILRMSAKAGLPAPLFRKVKGCPEESGHGAV